MALWFLVFDASRGRPLETPALLAAGVLHGAGAAPVVVTWELVLEYTGVHYAIFAVFGVVAAFLIVAAERETGLVSALIVFFVAFEVFFIALAMVLGPSVSSYVTWWSVLVGNVLASGVMIGWFFVGHRALGAALLGSWTAVLREGIVGGLIGAAVVAVWFLVYDLVDGRPLYTPALLGAALLQGLRDPAQLHITAAVLLGYTVLHGAAFVLYGVGAAMLLAAAEREPLILIALFVLVTCFEVFFFGLVMALDAALVHSLGWWTILIANIFATAAMVGYFLSRHRRLPTRLVEHWH